jgi:hypothetical protein
MGRRQQSRQCGFLPPAGPCYAGRSMSNRVTRTNRFLARIGFSP